MTALVPVTSPASKDDFRVLAKERRAAASKDIGVYADSLIAEQFFRHFPLTSGSIITGYWPIQDEIDPLPLMKKLHERGHPIGLPVVHSVDVPLTFREWRPGMEMVTSVYDTRVPPGSAHALIPDILLLPMLGFDRRGNRLGYGQGYYDQTLEHLRAEKQIIAVGIAFSMQEFTALPSEPHDQKLDWVVTENEAFKV